jgi:hypothetical protein
MHELRAADDQRDDEGTTRGHAQADSNDLRSREKDHSLSALEGGEGQPVRSLFAIEPYGANREERLAGLSVRWVY